MEFCDLCQAFICEKVVIKNHGICKLCIQRKILQLEIKGIFLFNCPCLKCRNKICHHLLPDVFETRHLQEYKILFSTVNSVKHIFSGNHVFCSYCRMKTDLKDFKVNHKLESSISLLDLLPEELYYHILTFLNYKDRSQLFQVCRKRRSLFSVNLEVRLIFSQNKQYSPILISDIFKRKQKFDYMDAYLVKYLKLYTKKGYYLSDAKQIYIRNITLVYQLPQLEQYLTFASMKIWYSGKEMQNSGYHFYHEHKYICSVLCKNKHSLTNRTLFDIDIQKLNLRFLVNFYFMFAGDILDFLEQEQMPNKDFSCLDDCILPINMIENILYGFRFNAIKNYDFFVSFCKKNEKFHKRVQQKLTDYIPYDISNFDTQRTLLKTKKKLLKKLQ